MTELLYVDIETGGIPVSTGIYEVGLIATVNGRIVDTLTIGKVINPSRLSEGMGQGYACVSDDEQYINQFNQFVAKYPYPFVAHKASFDRGFLVHYGWVDKNADFIDTLPLFRKHLPLSEIADHKLGTIMDYYGVQVDGVLHTAIADLKGLVECVNKSGILGDFSTNSDIEIPYDDLNRFLAERIPSKFKSLKNYIQYNPLICESDVRVSDNGFELPVVVGDNYKNYDFKVDYLSNTVKFDVDFIDIAGLEQQISKEHWSAWVTEKAKRFKRINNLGITVITTKKTETIPKELPSLLKMKRICTKMTVQLPADDFDDDTLEALSFVMISLNDFAVRVCEASKVL